MPEQILVIGMAGAGNLGDDLISVILIERINEQWPKAAIGVLVGGYGIPFAYPSEANLHFLKRPQLNQWTEYFGRNRALKEFIRSCDLLMVGGGGLLQDTHHPFNVYNWLKYTTQCNMRRCAIWGVGLGVGPFKHRHSVIYLREILPVFSVLQVRDRESANMLARFGVEPVVSTDIVAGSRVERYGFVQRCGYDVLGCSLRPWVGLHTERLLDLLARLAADLRSKVHLFVFEYYEPTNISEYEYARLIAQMLKARGVRAEVFCYGRTPLQEFCEAFCTVNRAVAMRLHAAILWHKIGVPVLPISYAPKLVSLYSEPDCSALVLSADDLDNPDPRSLQFRRLNLRDHRYKLPDAGGGSMGDRKWDSRRLALLNKLLGSVSLAYSVTSALTRCIRSSHRVKAAP